MKLLAPLFCQRALSSLTEVPTAERADFFDFASSILNDAGCREQADAARQAATDLRNADAAQARFDALLNAAIDQNKIR